MSLVESELYQQSDELDVLKGRLLSVFEELSFEDRELLLIQAAKLFPDEKA